MSDLNAMLPASRRSQGGMVKPNRPPVEHEPSAAEHPNGGVAAESEPTPRLSADVWQGAKATGDLATFGAMSTRPVSAVPGPNGEPGSKSQIPSNYPIDAPSRHPNVGSSPAKKSLAKVQNRK